MNPLIDLDYDDVRRGLDDGSILLVDVREAYEYAAGHIPGSISVPLSTFVPAVLPEAGGRRIVFSCKAGVRSAQAVALMQQAGYPLREHYRGSFADWLGRGGAVAFGPDD
ncbi:Sulfurtransferase [Hyphomicrobiales bacterium]|nr:Sulfurtransferase [Hyphomicrobiales bacterium]CAH1667870.1 Rhodanese-related sulfurtransferase [Hyphomicrobiales bacterium]